MSPVDYKQIARKTAKKYGLPEPVFLSLVQHESGWNAGISSPAGAIGLTQLMPGTAKSLGVDPHDPAQNLDGGARYLKRQLDKYGKIDLALAAYNAGPGAVDKYGGVPPYKETRHYVRNIMASLPATTTTSPALAKQALPTGPLSTKRLPRPTSTPLPFASTADTALANIGKIAQGAKPTSLMQGLVEASEQERLHPDPETLPFGTPAAPLDPVSLDAPLPAGKPSKQAGAWKRWVSMDKGADRAAMATRKPVLEFVGKIGETHGRPLAIGTGTQHNQYVAGRPGHESAHWTGWAADIPAEGDELTRLGQDALIAAGMKPAEARRQTGGVFNVNGKQILFNTKVGGNHYNHLHVGLHRSV